MKPFIIGMLLLALATLISAIPPLPAPRGAGTAIVHGDSIYYFGGSNDWNGSSCYRSILLYDGSSWTTLRTLMTDSNTWDVHAVALHDTVYFVSGWRNAASNIRRWTLSGSSYDSLATNANTQSWGTTVELIGRAIYLFNGYGEVYRYQIDSNQWTQRTTRPSPLMYDGYLGSIVYNNEVYVIGYNDYRFAKYNPANDTWTMLQTPVITDTISMQAPEIGIYNNELIEAACLFNGGSSATVMDSSIYVYNPAGNMWRRHTSSMTSARAWSSGVMYRGGFYLLGGLYGPSQNSALDSVMLVDPFNPVCPSQGILPGKYQVSCHPNPFNATTTISYTLPKAGIVRLSIVDVLGREVVRLIDEETHAAGEHRVEWNAGAFASGVYLLRLEANDFVTTRKLVLTK